MRRAPACAFGMDVHAHVVPERFGHGWRLVVDPEMQAPATPTSGGELDRWLAGWTACLSGSTPGTGSSS